ncbi:MEMO1-like [Asbolus verrucosus]|uniref:MEMO1-like n=1 Tax=Asbolus verrucosus TaxID=1661398 RepID=A0A482W0T0_ASBVE|nr:MEMO1-like [Asbolus verrucosus]
MSCRKAKHAGSWYTGSEHELSNQLASWLQKADFIHGPARAIIVPHAGYRYCGACSAHAYRQVSPEVVRRVFILGPSHHISLSGCALASVSKYKTPLYDLLIDSKVNKELNMTGYFEWIDPDVDEKEHSIEMQLPFIAKVMESYKDQFTIIPILVGTVNQEKQLRYGKILLNYLRDPQNLFVISSDFCHWGSQFRFTYYDSSYGHIYESTEHLDRMGMNIIENLNPVEFIDYLKKYGNTICGRHVIGILLQMIQQFSLVDPKRKPVLKFLKYTQSNQCVSTSDSSI